jgi:amino acid transporter
LLGHDFATSIAFETAFGQRWIVQVIFLAAILSLLKVFNGNFLASSRLLFALGRKNLIDPRLGQIHPVNQTPSPAIIAVGLATGAATFLGQALIVPITEVGSMASAFGWMAACAAYSRMDRRVTQRAVAACGVAIAGLLVGIKLLPGVPGHFSFYEWVALAGWCALGLIFMRKSAAKPEAEPA